MRRAMTIETGLFETQANHLSEFRQARGVLPASREVVYAMFGRPNPVSYDPDPAAHDITTKKKPCQGPSRIPSDLLSILPSSSRVAFCVLPICPTSHSTA
jgi:hypothetical protein